MRKTLLTIILILVFVIVGAIAMLALPSLATPNTTSLDRSPQLVALSQRVPADAAQLYFVHSVASLYRTLRRSDIAGAAIAALPNESQIQLATLALGNADAVLWFESDRPHAVIRASALRRGLTTIAARIGGLPLQSADGLLFYDIAPGAAAPSPIDGLTVLGSGLPGSVFVYDRSSKRDNFPPLARPSLTALLPKGETMLVHARGTRAAMPPSTASPAFEIPGDAMFNVVLHGSSDAWSDLDRILPLNIARLASDGVALSLYELDSERLVPRPRGVVVLPDSESARGVVASLFNASLIPGAGAATSSRQVGEVKIDRVERLGATVEVARLSGHIVVALDGKSLDRYLSSKRVALATEPGEAWVLQIDPRQLRPALQSFGGNAGIKLLAPKVARRARELQKSLELAGDAQSISGVRRTTANWDEIELTISTAK